MVYISFIHRLLLRLEQTMIFPNLNRNTSRWLCLPNLTTKTDRTLQTQAQEKQLKLQGTFAVYKLARYNSCCFFTSDSKSEGKIHPRTDREHPDGQ
jgi:hypothetical protein